MSNVECLPDGRRLADLRVVDLKEELDKLGMPKNGSKSVLLQRLQEALSSRSVAPIQHQQAPQQVNPMVQQYLEEQKRQLEANRQAAAIRPSAVSFEQNQTNHGVAQAQGVGAPQTVQISAPPPPAQQHRQQTEAVMQVGYGRDDVAAEAGKSERHLRSQPVSSSPTVRGVRVGGAETEMQRSQMPVPGNETASAVGKEAITAADAARSDRRRTTKGPEKTASESVTEKAHDESKRSAADAGLGGDEVVIGEERMDDLEGFGEVHKTKKEAKVDKPKQASPVKAVKPEIKEKPQVASIPSSKTAETEAAASAEKGEKPARKRKWGTTTAGSRAQAVAISSESLKDIVGTVSASEIKSLEEKEQTVAVTRIVENGDMPAERRIISTKRIVVSKTDEAGEEPAAAPATTDDQSKEIKYTEENLIRVQTPSPAHSPISKVIHVRGLVRPFTVKALHELLHKFGSFNAETDFWIDNVKSRCIVKFETEEQAIKARDGLHRVQWPTTNEASLRVDFAKEEELEEAVIYSKPQDKKTLVESDQTNRRPDESAEHERGKDRDRRVRRSASPGRVRRSAEREKQLWPREREWDRGKDSGQQAERNRARSRSKSPLDRDRRRRSQSPRLPPGEKKEEVPAKLLDELFKKTKVLPSIYWLPLSDDQVSAREKEREERRQARRRQLEEEDRMNQQERGRERVDRRRRSRTPTPERFMRRR